MAIEIRPMTEHDIDQAARVWLTAFATLLADGAVPDPPTDEELERTRGRYRYLLDADPGGSIVAEADGVVVGVAEALVRGPIFTLANLGVLPDHQDHGIGRDLLAAALEYGAGTNVGYVFSSSDPRALHRYADAGFDVHPAMEIAGRPRAIDGSLSMRPSDGSVDDLDLVDRIDAALAGRTRRGDIAFMVANGSDLYICDDGAYALANGSRLAAFGATDVTVARRAFTELLCGALTDEPVATMWVTSSQQWAFDAAADARATLRSRGAIMTRGTGALPAPYLPNGLFG